MLSFLRDSEEGKIEERKPMFGFRFPQWFADKYPSKMAAFRTNAKERLVTPFDIHATLHHLLDIEKDKYELPHAKTEKVRGKPRLSLLQNHLPRPLLLLTVDYDYLSFQGTRAISLLQEIPRSRTCDQADIEPHWCACMNWQKLTISSKEQKLCQAAVDFLNSLTQSVRAQCAELRLKEAQQVAVMQTPEALRKFKKTKDADGYVPELSDTTKLQVGIYMLKFVTEPNDGIYEMTIELKGGKLVFNDRTISRTNAYGDQPKCVMDKMPHLRKYCYCNGN